MFKAKVDRLTLYDAVLDYAFGNGEAAEELPPLFQGFLSIIALTIEKSETPWP